MRMKTHLILSLAVAMGAAVFAAPSCIPKEEKKQEAAKEPPPPPPPEPSRSKLKISDGAYQLVASEANKCVQFVGAGNLEGAHAEIQPCNNSTAQQFKLQPVPGAYYKLVNVASSKCFGSDVASTESGAYVLQQSCNDAAQHQHWIVADAPGGALQLVARHNGKALDVGEGKTTDGAQLIIFPNTAGPNQKFKLLPVGSAPEPAAGAPKAAGTGGTTAAAPEGGKGAGKPAKKTKTPAPAKQ
jgi:hypothetical protein